MKELEALGPRLRALRHARGLTLDQLAEASSVSASTISRLESGKRQASLELLLPLTRHLGARIDDLLGSPDGDPRVRRPSIHKEGHVFAPLTAESAPLQTYKVTYPPVTEVPAPRVHDGYEWLFVLSGRLLLRLGETDTVLTKGEAAEFDTRTPHSLSALGGRRAEVISIFNESGVRMHTHALGSTASDS
ncbi:XRE family transcriptional regulator [Chryseoglobus sp. 28M-23]|jgi:transcriptional regulator with XRE-family HTH domain|uniref:helix-turn-helix domain-containing protein n=1 Tax=Chryseoglobus sp. 28M-23 TaxID=2772253 RepID=UPI0017476713|nr:XRE family transcriptional regulator [Chryseoglobus sp. 28M-23]MBU1251117.1 XRE family transcriptional regulator [Actinomycetota bacterium]MBU1608857.1 XRE family transcriptional regulator [Actinomycetota bacterium]MBU2314552.1 XRE family transcriptional regulator [Actinomycetota bacterium]MBU2384253.1 XRE family transcriptional regulator [Actinomycetota bacterium]QOD92747.1 helix-turn-helix domain-containing protein [Chryseoglobus sp. 28M-23]